MHKYTPDDHYCAALYKYSRQLVIMFKEYIAFTSTNDKCKIKIGESNFPVPAVTWVKQVFVTQRTFLQAANHNHASSTLIPTVLLSHKIPNNTDNSWYRGVPYVYLKLVATEPSSAIRNAAEVKRVLISKFGKNNIPPIVIFYTEGGPEHRTTFLSVKTAMIALQQAINADLLVALRTVPGHSFRNPAEKVNCILNLGLYGIGVMHQSIYEDTVFEKNLHTCSNLEVGKLLNQKPTDTDLYKKSCEPYINLIKDSFSQLKLKDNSFKIFDIVNDNEVDRIWVNKLR